MRTVAAIIASLLLSIVTFSIGAIGAVFYVLTPESASGPRATHVVDLWTTEPKVVAQKKHQLEVAFANEIPSSHSEQRILYSEAVERTAFQDAELDGFTTSSVDEEQNQSPRILSREHVHWCMSRYNSYRAEDGTYQPYNGKRRPCVSPYMADETDVYDKNGGAANEILQSAQRSVNDDDQNGQLMAADITDHTRNCSERYKSYRSEDNTYQPFNGGPRRQCR